MESRLLKFLRTAFFSGIILLLPVAATVWVISFLLNNIGLPTSLWLFYFIDPVARTNIWINIGLSAISTLVVILFITAFGLFSRYFLGRFIVNLVEGILSQLPLVKTIYKTTKQIVETFRQEDKKAFQKVVLIEYPRPGVHAIAFQTNTSSCEIQEKVNQKLIHVFMPTCPNPTTGFLFLIPEHEIIYLDMPIGDAMKLIISCGAVMPQKNAPIDHALNEN